MLFVFGTYRNMQHTKQQSKKVSSSMEFLSLTDKLIYHLQELENTQRDFVYSGPARLRVPYLRAINNLSIDNGSLNGMELTQPSKAKTLDEISKLLLHRIDAAWNTFDVIDSASTDSTIQWLSKGEEQRLADSIKARIFNLAAADKAIQRNANTFLENATMRTSLRFYLLAFIFFAILVFFLFLILNNLKKKGIQDEQLSLQASLINTIPDAIFTTDDRFIITSWNKYASELYGVAKNEAIGQSINSIFKTHLTGEQLIESLNVLRSKGAYNGEYMVTKRNGQNAFILASVSTITNEEGIITGYTSVHRDISRRRQLEKELTVFNTQLAEQVQVKTAETFNILERITDGFLALDSNFVFTYVNKRAGEILGHNTEDMIGKNIFTDFGRTTSNAFNVACYKAYQDQHYRFLENFYEPLRIWLENYIYPSADGLSIFFKDITLKKKTELALKESESHYKQLIDNLHAGVVVHAPDTAVLLTNQEAAKLLGISAEEMQNKKAAELKLAMTNTEGVTLGIDDYPVIKVLQSRKPINNLTIGIDVPETNDKRWLLVNAFPEFGINEILKQVVVTFVDITDRKKSEEELKRSEEILNQAQNIAKTGSWELNPVSYELKWSKELYRIFELKNIVCNNELYKAYRKKIHPDDLPKLDRVVQFAIDHKRGYKYQHRIIKNDGSIKHILNIGEVVLDIYGNVNGLKGTAQDITELVKAEEKLQQSYKQIKQLVKHLHEVREQERTSIAREIHDELGQQLTGLKMYVSSLQKKVMPQDEEIKERFMSALDLIEETIKSVRKISMDLRPSMLDDLGLLAAIEWQCGEFEKRSGIATEFINLTGNKEVPAALKTGLFRIFQESLTNVARHADAKRVVSSLKFEDNNFMLTITDDGKGFLVTGIGSKRTLGIFGMQERTKEMGGKYEIKSEPGIGTTVSVTVPA